MQKTQILELENEINELTNQRSVLFEEWAEVVKSNDREFEMTGRNSAEQVKKADELLAKQKAIGRQIMRLLEKLDNLSLKID
jgi:hypothetical protein